MGQVRDDHWHHQGVDRAGGKVGNKGYEVIAIEMAILMAGLRDAGIAEYLFWLQPCKLCWPVQ